MKIAFVASEVNPLAKSGGLADVTFALGKELVKMGDEVIAIMPFYDSVKKKSYAFEEIGELPVHLSWRFYMAKIFVTVIGGMKYYLIDCPRYFARPALYGYDDDAERFAFFTVASRNLFEMIDFAPDIIHIHDWQPGMLPTLIKNQNKNNPYFKKTKFVLTIHNPEFKGFFDRYYLNDFYGLPDSLFDDGTVRFDGMCSSLKAAIIDCEKITTVSPTHREELLQPGLSRGLDGVLRLRENDFCGIVNGIDGDEWDPSIDPLLPHHFSLRKIGQRKEARKALFEAIHLDDNGGPVYGLVSRLTYQKGIDLIPDALRPYLQQGANFVLLGSGEYGLEQAMERLREEFPHRVSLYIGYSDERAHLIYGGSDFFLMPSLFEPCGIGQMLAERYGSLPIARNTGGLHDTIIDYNGSNEDEATGFLFDNFDVGGLAYGIRQSFGVYQDKKLFAKMQKNAMEMDHFWKSSAELYRGVYREIVQ